jgi:dTDP-4-amino-4,6-dideoxygalactose transaminase
VGVKNVLCLNSATAGLELMLRWLGVNEEDEVIVPCYTYSATANVVMHCNANLVLVDVGTDFNIDVEKVRAAITKRTKVIMPVDFAGFPCDYDALNALVREKDIQSIYSPHNVEQENLGRILILADAAHSLGAKYKGKRTGVLADATAFSFHAVKNLTTAEGGALCLNLPAPFDNAAVYKQLYIKSLHGQTKDALAKTQKGAWEYDIIEAGYKCNMPDIAAAIGLAQFKVYESEIEPRRKEIMKAYENAFINNPKLSTPIFENEDKVSSFHLYPLLLKQATLEERNVILQKIFDQDVSVNVHFKPIPLLSFYAKQGFQMKHYPVSESLWEREISLPVYASLSNDEVQLVIQAVLNAIS